MSAKSQKEESTDLPTLLKSFASIAIGIIAATAAAIGTISEDHERSKVLLDHLATTWWIYAAAGIALLAGFVFVRQFLKRDEAIRALLVVCVVVPLLVGIILAIVLMPPRWQEGMARLVFILIAAILPAAMYYLFLAAKRPSLFEEYVANLRRLNLIRENMSQLDLDAYLQKFEASYGGIQESSRERLITLMGLGTPLPEKATQSGATSNRLGRLVAFQAANLLTPNVLLPLALSTILIGVGWLLVLPPLPPQGTHSFGISATLMLHSGVAPVGFAFLGAYFFSLQTLFRRFVLNDLRPSAYIAVCQRIVLSVIAVWILLMALQSDAAKALGIEFAQTNTQDGGPHVATNVTTTVMILAFVVGVFPALLWDFLMVVLVKLSFAEKYFRRMTPELPLSLLDGLTIFHETRLEEEDIENIPNMATVDIVQLMIGTRFAPNRIIDWVDQAILYTALGPEDGTGQKDSAREKLRLHGVRTASALLEAYNMANRPTNNASTPGHESTTPDNLKEVLAIIDTQGRSPVQTLVDTLTTNPNLHLILAWQARRP